MTESAAQTTVDGVLRNARQANSIVVIVGAGLSAVADLPDWRSVIIGQEDAAHHPDLAVGQKLESYSRSASSTLSARRRLVKTLTELAAHSSPSPVHIAIAKLLPAAIVTVNYDSLIEDSIRSIGGQAVVLTRNDALDSVPDGAIPVFKIFGSLHEPSTITTDFSGSLLSPADEPNVTQLLRTTVAVSLVIAVGFELNSGQLGSLYEQFGNTAHGSWFILAEGAETDPVTRSLWTNRGVQVIDVGSADPSYFFKALRTRLDTLHEPPQRTSKAPQVFVSHAGDASTVSAIYDYLRALGLKPVGVADVPMSGQTILERLDYLVDSSDAAVVVLGSGSSSDQTARSNTIFELGWLAGRLGRDRVLTVVTPDATFPSDIGGFQYFVFDSTRRESLRTELSNWARHLALTDSTGSADR